MIVLCSQCSWSQKTISHKQKAWTNAFQNDRLEPFIHLLFSSIPEFITQTMQANRARHGNYVSM